MSGVGPALVVRRRDIESDPHPAGGGFAEMRVLPVPVPRFISGMLGVFCANTSDRVVSLTYDDGPHPHHTPRILDALARYEATATFFVLARQVLMYPELAKRVVAEGHQLALHGHDHRSLLSMPTSAAISRIREARHSVEAVVGAPITLYRPPYGEMTIRQAVGIRRLGLDVVMWSGDPLDWMPDSEDAIANRALASVFPGGILLLHDDRGDPETLAAGEPAPDFDRARVTELILQSLSIDGFRSVSVSSLLSDYQPVRSIARHAMAQQR